jgi:hypothetical protein
VRNEAAQVVRQHPDAAADVEAAPGAVRNGGEDHTVVMEVVVPPRWASAHHVHDLTAAVRRLTYREGW